MSDMNFLLEGMRELGIDTDNNRIEKLLKFEDILIEWNEKINLTTIIEKKDIYVKHFFDSATCISTGLIKSGASVIDVGTGAGFPGVVIKILREDVNLTLLDSLNKRINYLSDVAKRLNLGSIDLVHGRAEEYGVNKGYRQKFDVVLSRAVANMNVLSEYCIPFVNVGGYFLCQKGPGYKEELEDSQNAIKLLGGKVLDVEEYQLPFSDITHYIIIIQKIFDTPTKYPRKPGKPVSNPIL